MVVGAGRPELVHLRRQKLGRLERRHAVEVGHLVEGTVHRALGRGAVVADDVVDDRVVEHPKLIDRIDHPADVMVGVLEEAAYTSIWRARIGFISSGMSSQLVISSGRG